jgi:fibronectin-binding autotransporter adhesin
MCRLSRGLFCAIIALLSFSNSLSAQWTGATTGNTNDAAHSYLTTANWVGGTVLSTFSPTLTAATTLRFSAGYSTGGDFTFTYAGAFGLTLTGGGTVNASGGAVAAAAQTITLGGNYFQDTVNNQTITFGGTGTSALTLDLNTSTARIFNIAAGDTTTTNSPIISSVANGGLTKSGAGTMNIQANTTFTGATIVNGGTLTLAGAASAGRLSNSASIQVMGGGTFNGGSATIGNNTLARVLGTPSVTLGSPTLGGGTYSVSLANTSVVFTENFAALEVSSGNNIFQTRNTAGAGSLVTQAFASEAPLRTAVGGVLVMAPVTANYNVTFTGADNAFLGGWLTSSENWAKKTSGVPTPFAGSDYTDDTYTPGTHAHVANNTTVAATTSVESIRFNNVSARTLTIAAGQTLTVNSGGIINANSVGNELNQLNGGIITSGNGTDLIIHNFNTDSTNEIRIGSQVIGNIGITKSGTGLVSFSNANNTFTGNVYSTQGTINFDTLGSLPLTATVNLIGGNFQNGGVSQTRSNTFILGQTASIAAADSTVLTLTGNVTAGTNRLNVGNVVTNSGIVHLAPSAGNAVTGTSTFAVQAQTSINSLDTISTFGNLLISGPFVIDSTGVLNPSFDNATGNLVSGMTTRSFGTGAGQWQFSGEGSFIARGNPVSINLSIVGSSFDRNVTLGSSARQNGPQDFFANAPVTFTQNTTLTAQRSWRLAVSGPGVSGAANSGVVNVISGNIGGAGSLTISSYAASELYRVGELVLGGTNNWTGSATATINTGAIFNSGPGGLIITGESAIRFNGQSSLPTGNAGNPAYLAAMRRNSDDGRYGFLITGSPGGQSYVLPTGYRFVIGGIDSAANFGIFGSTGGLATLSNSAIAIHDHTDAQTLILVVRDGVLTLGGGAGPVSFQPSAGISGAAGTLTSPATPLTDATGTAGARLISKRGVGTVVLDNVVYQLPATLTDATSQFSWNFSGGTATFFNGAIRETDSTATTSLINVPLTIRAGVLEFAKATPRAITLGTAVGQVVMNGTGGGGFSAFSTNVTLGINAGVGLTWNSTTNFLAAQPLIFGSTTSTHTLTLTNTINLNAGSRSILVVRGAGSLPEGQLDGDLTGTGASNLIVSAITSPNGGSAAPFMTAGTLVLNGPNNSYGGTTSVQRGATLFVNGTLATGGGTVTVGVDATNTGRFGGTGTVNRNVVVNASSTFLPGGSGIGTFTLGNDLTLESAIFAFEAGDVTNIAGILTINGTSTLNATGLDGTTTYTVASFANTALPGTFTTVNAPGYFADYTLTSVLLIPIPEPSLMLGLAGLAVVGFIRRR